MQGPERAPTRAEEALRRSEANLRAIFNTSLQAFVLVDRDGTIQALNPIAAAWAISSEVSVAATGELILRSVTTSTVSTAALCVQSIGPTMGRSA